MHAIALQGVICKNCGIIAGPDSWDKAKKEHPDFFNDRHEFMCHRYMHT